MKLYEICQELSYSSETGKFEKDENAALGLFLYKSPLLAKEVAELMSSPAYPKNKVIEVPVLNALPPSFPIQNTITLDDAYIEYANRTGAYMTHLYSSPDPTQRIPEDKIKIETVYSVVRLQRDTASYGKIYDEIGILANLPFGIYQLPPNIFQIYMLERKVITNEI